MNRYSEYYQEIGAPPAPQVPAALIECAAWESVWGLLKDPALLLRVGRAYHDALGNSDGDASEALASELERQRARLATTQAMMQNPIPYAKGKSDIRACEERIRLIEQELRAAAARFPCRRSTPPKPRCARSQSASRVTRRAPG